MEGLKLVGSERETVIGFENGNCQIELGENDSVGMAVRVMRTKWAT